MKSMHSLNQKSLSSQRRRPKNKLVIQRQYIRAIKMDAKAGDITAENASKSMNDITGAFEEGEKVIEESYSITLVTIEQLLEQGGKYTEEWAIQEREKAKRPVTQSYLKTEKWQRILLPFYPKGYPGNSGPWMYF